MTKPFNIFIMNTPHDSWENYLIDDLKTKGIINNAIVHKTGQQSKKRFLNLGEKGLEGKYMAVPLEVYERLYQYLPKFIDMYCRVTPFHSGTYSELNFHQYLDHFNLILNYYYSLFIENKIDLFIHNNSPHVGYDYIPNILAEELGIKTLYLEQSIFPNKFYYYWKFEDYGDFETSGKIFELEGIKIENKFEKEIPYMNKKFLKGGFKFSKIKNFRTLNNELNSYVPGYQFIKEIIRSEYRGQAHYRYKLKKKYEENLKKLTSSIDLEVPFVYFGLHLQPEKSTSSWGGKYSDHALALEHLSAILPEGWKIYVKENPKQTYFMRNPEFFRRLERIPSLELVSSDFNTYDLIRNSKINATISGSIGWESITGGKPALIFGWGVWYKTLPGVYSFSPDLDLKEISKEKVNFKLLQAKLDELVKKMAPGIILNEYYSSIYDKYDEEENNRTVTKSIEAILKSKLN